jgi:hypothetical protein
MPRKNSRREMRPRTGLSSGAVMLADAEDYLLKPRRESRSSLFEKSVVSKLRGVM